MDYSKRNWRLKPHHRITDEQFQAILACAQARPRDWMLVFVPGNTGLRISEVLHIRVGDLHPESGAISVVRRKKKALEWDVLLVAKDFFSYAKSYVEEFGLEKHQWLFPGHCRPCYRTVTFLEKDDSGRVIDRRQERQRLCDGGHLTVRRAEAVWDRLLGAAALKVPGRGIHTLRHYDLTRFQKLNRDLAATQRRAGHASPVTTTIYAEIVDMEEKANHAGVSVSSAPWGLKKSQKGHQTGQKGPIRD